jgi:uncharacterized protein YyaL (SSP411 family)
MSLDETGENRLADETSPYLLLHKSNPVDWYPWGEEALARAKREDKPIFLSVGYSTCYWCHVMERESFSVPNIAAVMNRDFVCIKVDREERPDLDEIFMLATQILSHHGGWPNSVFLTPELRPFFAGTYFPPRDVAGRPGFPTVLASLAEAWRDRRPDVEEQAASVSDAMRRYLADHGSSASGGAVAPVPMEKVLRDMERSFDSRWGGFGGAPKFPTPANLLLLQEVAETDVAAARMLSLTLDNMARGGILDQLAGGFHRYSTDAEWKVPHFEKMLYDNALLLEVYAREWARTADTEVARVVRQTADFIGKEMTSPEGALWSAIDAETQGHEGAFYVWRREELQDALGDENFGFLAPLLGFGGAPFFEGDRYVLHMPQPVGDQARRRRLESEELWAQIRSLSQTLLDYRGRRQRPATDDKVLTDWNGLGISGLASAGRLLGDDELTRRATAVADFVLTKLRPEGGPLRHTWRAGSARVPAFLSDYAFLIRGLLELHESTGERRWRVEALTLAEEQEERLGDPSGGYYVAAESGEVPFRSKEIFDGALPSGNGIAIQNLLALAEVTGEERWLERANTSIGAFSSLLEHRPEAVKTLVVAAHRYREAVGRESEVESAVSATGPSFDLQEESRRAISAALGVGLADEDGWRLFRLELEIAEGWHVNAPSGDAAVPHLSVLGDGAEIRHLEWPTARWKRLTGSFEAVPVYEGRIAISGGLRADSEPQGRVIVEFQPCDESRCLPATSIALDLESAVERVESSAT